MADRPTLSACIIARDEEAHLPDCLASVAFCDEIVVVDSGSRDATAAIARAAGARVIEQPWLGYGAQRNVAADNATGDWVLEVDADERVSDALQAQIEAFLAGPPPAGTHLAALPLRDVLLGRPLGPSAKYPKYRHRLFRRGHHRHDEARTVHEGLVPDGPVHPFSGDLTHLLAESWREALGDTWRYARLEAGQLDAPRSAKAVLVGALGRPAVKLGYRLTIDGGWRDGWAGAVKIGLDCANDTIVWLRHATRRTGGLQGRSGVSAGMHFGAWRGRRGTPRLALLASGPAETARAARWAVRAAADAQADVVVITDATLPPTTAALRRHAVPRLGPILATRALDAEEQLRPLDAVITFGGAARRALRVLPAAPRDALVLDGDVHHPAAACAAALAHRDAEAAG
jgi:glycosyltransferase involved in cell wall biosynthesis